MTDDDTNTEKSDKSAMSIIKRIVSGLISVAVVVVIFAFVLPQLADYSQVREALEEMSIAWLVVVVVVGLWTISSYWLVISVSLPGLRVREAAVANLASTAVTNTVPAGSAFGVGVSLAMYTSWGFLLGPILLSMMITGIWHMFAKLAFPVFAVIADGITGNFDGELALLAVIGIVGLGALIGGFALLLRSDKTARKLGNLGERIANWGLKVIRRDPIGGLADKAADFRDDSVVLLRGRWVRLTIFALVANVSLYVLLVVSLRAVGVPESAVSWTDALVAYAIMLLVTAIPITPGGVGIAELGYVAILSVGQTDEMTNLITAGVMLFRFMSWFLPIPLGAGAWLFWRCNKSWRGRVGPEHSAKAEDPGAAEAVAALNRP